MPNKSNCFIEKQGIFFVCRGIRYGMLKTDMKQFYQVKAGQSVYDIADAFGVSAFKLSKENNLQSPVQAGQILRIPTEKGNAYTVQAGEDKRLLCGSDDRYFLYNGTHILYPGMKIRL